MSRYNHGAGTYYETVDGQPDQPTGHECSNSSTTNAASAYPCAATSHHQNAPKSGSYVSYNSSYAAPEQQQQQQYGSSAQSTTRTSSAMNILGSHDYGQQSGSASYSNAYDGSAWDSTSYSVYPGSSLQLPNRMQSNTSPPYATQNTSNSSNTFGRLTLPHQTQQSSSSYQQLRPATTTLSYSQQSQLQQPQRYNSPLQAVQAQQQQQQQQQQAHSLHSTQASRGSTQHIPSPQLNTAQHASVQQARQQSASVEPFLTTMTVNPSQVYDDTAERRRKAQQEAEKRRNWEAELAARKAEDAAARKAEAEHKAEARKKAREEKKRSKNAAATLQRMSFSGGGLNPSTGADDQAAPLNDEEAEMRAWLRKLHEFNARNPAMLTKLWEEERRTHALQSPLQAAKSKPASAPATTAQPATAASFSTLSSPVRPFTKPTVATPAKAPKAAKGASAKQAQAAATAAEAAQPIHAQANTSLWPTRRKDTLVAASTRWLTNLPENTGKASTKEELLRILDSNPSHAQLCEALERFDRPALARELLKAVPDGMKAQVSQQPPAPAPAPLSTDDTNAAPVNSSSAAPKKCGGRPSKMPKDLSAGVAADTVEYEAPKFTSLSDAAAEINAMCRPQQQRGLVGGPVQQPGSKPPLATPASAPFTPIQHIPDVSRPESAWQPPEIKPAVQPEEPRPPANKEEAARKRTFGDLVDLTAQDSDDEMLPNKIVFPTPVLQNRPNGPAAPFPMQPSAAATAPLGFGFSRPMNANEFYKGRSGQSMPWPLASPNSTPTHSLPSSVPPPPPPAAKTKGPSLERQQAERIRGLMLVEPIMRDRVARKSKYDSRTIARDVLLATGRHPDMRPLNSHLNIMAKLLGDHGGSYEDDSQRGNRADLSTIRWDIIDPDMLTKAGSRAKAPALDAVDDTMLDADEEDDEPSALERTVQGQVDNGDGTMSYAPVHDSVRIKKKPERPRKKRYSDGDALTLSNGQGQRSTVQLGGTPVRQAATNTPASAPAGVIGYSAFRQLDENGNVIKKKGRPVGWRKNIHSREAQGLAPAKPGAPRGPHRPAAAKQLVEPKYQVFKCGWKKCPAELHNLDTLKKHVVKVHGKPNESRRFECHWIGCEESLHSTPRKGKGKAVNEEGELVATFPALARWLEHVDAVHLLPVAWKQGDGPRGGTVGKFRPFSRRRRSMRIGEKMLCG